MERRKIASLLKGQDFDEAAYLYELYKTCTVSEVAHFKTLLDET